MLVKCSECGREISDKAEICVGCGAPVSVPPQSNGDGNETPLAQKTLGIVSEISRGFDKPYFGKALDSEGNQYLFTNNSLPIEQRGSVQPFDIVEFEKDFDTKGRLVRVALANPGRDERTKLENLLSKAHTKGAMTRKTEGGATITSQFDSRRIMDDSIGRNATSPRKTRKYVMWGVLVVAILYWLSVGTPNPLLLFAGGHAKSECLRLAEENRGSFLIGSGKLTAGSTWLKNGRRVVQLLEDDGDRIATIMCVYGGGMVEIPSVMNQGRWR